MLFDRIALFLDISATLVGIVCLAMIICGYVQKDDELKGIGTVGLAFSAIWLCTLTLGL
jgi:hypothetical protein